VHLRYNNYLHLSYFSMYVIIFYHYFVLFMNSFHYNIIQTILFQYYFPMTPKRDGSKNYRYDLYLRLLFTRNFRLIIIAIIIHVINDNKNHTDSYNTNISWRKHVRHYTLLCIVIITYYLLAGTAAVSIFWVYRVWLTHIHNIFFK